MNTQLLNVVRQILAKEGEAILRDPRRFEAILRDLASGVPKLERDALARCIGMGACSVISLARTAEERVAQKEMVAERIDTDDSPVDKARAMGALDLLEAALYGPVAAVDLADTIRKIVASEGDGVLSDPKRMKDLFLRKSEGASGVERDTVACCIDAGACLVLALARSGQERATESDACGPGSWEFGDGSGEMHRRHELARIGNGCAARRSVAGAVRAAEGATAASRCASGTRTTDRAK